MGVEGLFEVLEVVEVLGIREEDLDFVLVGGLTVIQISLCGVTINVGFQSGIREVRYKILRLTYLYDGCAKFLSLTTSHSLSEGSNHFCLAEKEVP